MCFEKMILDAGEKGGSLMLVKKDDP